MLFFFAFAWAALAPAFAAPGASAFARSDDIIDIGGGGSDEDPVYA